MVFQWPKMKSKAIVFVAITMMAAPSSCKISWKLRGDASVVMKIGKSAMNSQPLTSKKVWIERVAEQSENHAVRKRGKAKNSGPAIEPPGRPCRAENRNGTETDMPLAVR